MEDFLSFDDVVLVPQYSEVDSRHTCDLSGGESLRARLDVPVISANMPCVTGVEMCVALHEIGAIGTLHRFQNLSQLEKDLNHLESHNTQYIVSIGADPDLERLSLYRDFGCERICIDVAHGHHAKVGRAIKQIRDYYPECLIIAGNVATAQGSDYLFRAGADVVKCGIGNGSHCTTRIVTGHGVPQWSALRAVSENARHYKRSVIADGGIRHSGDIAKALAAGADYVMIGKLFAGCAESPAEEIRHGVKGIQKVYRGSASYESQTIIQGRDRKRVIAEGVQSYVPYTGSVRDQVNDLALGLKSALSYTGAFTIQELQERAQFARVTPSGYIEGTPHGA